MKLDVLFGPSEVIANGLSTHWDTTVTIATDLPNLNNVGFHHKLFYYRPNLDRSSFLKPGVWREQLCLIPTRERAVIDYIQNQDVLDEGELCMAVDYYYEFMYGDLSKLYEVAEAMGSSKEEVDHWVYEARVVGY